MQGMNFQIDSTYIPNTIQNTDTNSLSQTNSKVRENGISFMDMLQSEIKSSEAPKEIRRDEKTAAHDDYVRKTDTDVNNSKTETAQNTEKAASADRDVNNRDSSASEKSEKLNESKDNSRVSEKNADSKDEKKLKPELDSKSILSHIFNSAKRNAVQENNKTENSAADKNGLLKNVKLADKKIDFSEEKLMLEQFAQKIKEDTEDEDLLSAQFMSVQEPASFIKQISKESADKNTDVSVKDVKAKKETKKLTDVFTVTDLRTEKKDVSAEKKSDFVTSVKQTANDTVQVTMDLSSQAEKNILSMNGQTASAQGSTFQAMLENQIAENAEDFVKAGNIVLKDNNVGKINLILHPENLGNVKISLELTDKVVTGKILVSSQEAFNAFNSTQDNLKTAFIESGFDGASFDVAFANQNQNFAGQNQDDNPNSRAAANAYGELVVENVSVDENNSDTLNDVRDYSINIVA